MEVQISHCEICHRILTDPVSIAIGIGPECRSGKKHGRLSRVHAARLRSAEHAIEFHEHNLVKLSNGDIYAFTASGWSCDGQAFYTDEQFKDKLEKLRAINLTVLKNIENMENKNE
jgi:Family of unknown function (DUF6011)